MAPFRHQHAPAALSRKTDTAPSLLRRTTAEDPSSLTGGFAPPKRFAFRYCPVTRENSGCCPSSSPSMSSTSSVKGVRRRLSPRSFARTQTNVSLQQATKV